MLRVDIIDKYITQILFVYLRFILMLFFGLFRWLHLILST